MKSYLILVLTFFLVCLSSFAYTNDIEFSECIKNAGESYSNVYDCVCARKEYYKSESEKLLKELETQFPKTSYEKIINNQALLVQYIQSLDDGEIKILNDTQGVMYQTFSQEILLMIHETNFQILSLINNDSYNRNKLSQTPTMLKLNLCLNKLKNNLTREQYDDIIQSQYYWELYRNDIIKNIQPLISTLELKKYIRQIIIEDRINALTDLDSLFAED